MAKAEPTPTGYQYQNIYEIPEPFRSLGGTMLTVQQANWISSRAHELGFWNKDDADGSVTGEADSPINFVPHWGQARDEFRDAHEVQGGLWVEKKGDA